MAYTVRKLMTLKIQLEQHKGAWFATIDRLRVYASDTTRDRALAKVKAGALMVLFHELEEGTRKQRGLSSIAFRVAA